MTPWRGHGQFLADDPSIVIDDHDQFAIMMAEGQAVPALVLAAATLDATSDGPALHLPEKIFDREFHCPCGCGRIDFRHAIGPTNSGHF
jgi:hypothetical protein